MIKRIFNKEIFLTVLTSLLLVPIFIMAFYARPLADDYDYSILTHRALVEGKGIIGLVKAAFVTDWNFYNTTQGLYTAAFWHSLQPGIWGEKWYGIGTICILLVVFVSWIIALELIKNTLIRKYSKREIILNALFLTFAFSYGQPDYGEGLFWFNGMNNYTPFMMFTIINFALMISLWFDDRNDNKVFIVISVILSFYISGGNHVSSFSNILLLTVTVILGVLNKDNGKRYYAIAPLLSALFGFFIMYIAPGTRHRESTLISKGFTETIRETGIHTTHSIIQWTNATLFAMLILMTPIAFEIAGNLLEKLNEKGLKIRGRHIVLEFLIFLMVLCGMFAVPYYAMGYFGYGRLWNVVYMMFLLFSFIFYLTVLALLIQEKNLIGLGKGHFVFKNDITYIALAVVSLFIIFSNSQNHIKNASGVRIVQELLDGTAKMYRDVADMRLFYYTDTSFDEVKVAPYQDKTSILFLTDLNEEADHWINRSISEYYEKRIVLCPANEVPTSYSRE